MSADLVPRRPQSQGLSVLAGQSVPALVAQAGPKAGKRFLEFFTAQIRNPNTREAYARAVVRFLVWCERRGIQGLDQVEPMVVAAYVEGLGRELAAPSVKQHLAAIRMLFDWLVTGQIVEHNPASSVRGPKHVVRKGKTPVLTSDQARTLLDSIPTTNVTGLRDRALIGLMVYSFARISAVLGMRVSDYYPDGKRCWFRLHEKGGRFHEVPAHHNAEAYLDAYLAAARIAAAPSSPLFRSIDAKRTALTDRALDRKSAWSMVRRRARKAGFPRRFAEKLGNHTFRATGITAYLENGGTIEKAQLIAGHESPRTTKLYDRTDDQLTLDEIERIAI